MRTPILLLRLLLVAAGCITALAQPWGGSGVSAQSPARLTLTGTFSANLPSGGWAAGEGFRLYGVRGGYLVAPKLVLWGSAETGSINTYKCPLAAPDCLPAESPVQLLAGAEYVFPTGTPATFLAGAGAGTVLNLLRRPEWNVVIHAGFEVSLSGPWRGRAHLHLDRVAGLPGLSLGVGVGL
jgi:hypothetical protein